MVTANVLQRTFQIKVNDAMGTCFALDMEGRQYLITARHLVRSLAQNAQVSIYHEKKWKTLSVNVVGHGQNLIDVSVLSPSSQLVSKDLPLPATWKKIVWGQDVYFLGFPYGLHSDVGVLNRDFPLPLIKKGTLSAIIAGDSGDDIFLIDGHVNPGFSGGPVVFSEIGGPSDKLIVAGVVSAHRMEPSPVILDGKETGLKVYEDTGIMISYHIRFALGLISANPIGLPIS